MRIIRRIVLAAFVTVAASCTPANQSAAEKPNTQPPDANLASADQDSANWLMYGRTYDDHRFSPLNQINEQSVAKLGLAWSREMGTTRGLEATPLVEDGIIYATG